MSADHNRKSYCTDDCQIRRLPGTTSVEKLIAPVEFSPVGKPTEVPRSSPAVVPANANHRNNASNCGWRLQIDYVAVEREVGPPTSDSRMERVGLA